LLTGVVIEGLAPAILDCRWLVDGERSEIKHLSSFDAIHDPGEHYIRTGATWTLAQVGVQFIKLISCPNVFYCGNEFLVRSVLLVVLRHVVGE
jgi:hypothetical protein